MRAWFFDLGQRASTAARAALAALIFIGGCGGVDSGGTGAVNQGAVAGLGSVIVNGIRFDDTSATLRDDDDLPVARSRLALGVMTRIDSSPVVSINGVQRALASMIHVSSDLIGPVTAADPATNTLTVLGQTVVVTPATVFDATIAGPLPDLRGLTVEVYGRYDPANARYTATRIEPRANPANYKLRALVTSVNSNARTFVMGGLTISYASLSAGDAAVLGAGKLVRVNLALNQGSSNIWVATRAASALVTLPDRDRVEVEGRITSWVSSRSFSVDGIVVDASRARFEDDSQDEVVLGARVSVEGSSVGGILVASKVEAEDDENSTNSTYEVHGTITSIDIALKRFVVLGVTVDYSGTVNYSGGTAATLAVGRNVDVHGTLGNNGTVVRATEISIN